MLKKETAYYHLPGLFEFYGLYSEFLPLFREHREYIFMTGAILVLYMELRLIVFGAEAVLALEKIIQKKF